MGEGQDCIITEDMVFFQSILVREIKRNTPRRWLRKVGIGILESCLRGLGFKSMDMVLMLTMYGWFSFSP